MSDDITAEEYSFVLKEICNPNTLQICYTKCGDILDGPLKNSFRKYINKHVNSDRDNDGYTFVYVHYTTKIFEHKSIGRMYPTISTNGINPEIRNERKCMTFSHSMPKILRDSLCVEIYHDIDFVNSHCSILLQLLKNNNISCKYLEKYVNNRDVILYETCEYYNIEKEIAKNVFIQILYGANITKWKQDNNIVVYDDYDFIIKFQKCIRTASSALLSLEKYSRYIRYSKYNSSTNPFSAISYILMTIENKCLIELYKHYLSLGYAIGSFEYDGLKIQKKKGMDIFPEEHIKSGQEYIKKQTGYDIRLTEKPMEFNDMLKSDIKIYTINNQIHAAEIILEKSKDKIIYSRSNKQIYYKSSEHTWSIVKDKNDLNFIVADFNLILATNVHGTFYNKFEPNITNISKSIITIIAKHSDNCVDDFESMIFQTTIGKLCYNNGVYDFHTKELIPWSDSRTNNIYTTVIVTHDLDNNSENYKNEKEYLINLMSEQFGNIFSEFFTLLSRAIAGYAIDKRWFTLFGTRNSGKGVFCDLLEETFGSNYIDITNSDNFVRKANSSDSERSKGWIIPIRYARLIISNEIDPSCVLNGILIKELCSGGDGIRARSLYTESIKFKHQFTYMICCNDIPKIDPIDANKTRVAIDMPFSYVPPQDILEADENERKMLKPEISDIKQVLKNNKKYRDAFASIIFDHFVDNKPELKLLKDMNDTFLDNPSDVNKNILKYFEIDKTDDSLFIPNSIFRDKCKEIRAALSINDTDIKIKRLLKSKGATDHKSYDRGLKFVKLKE